MHFSTKKEERKKKNTPNTPRPPVHIFPKSTYNTELNDDDKSHYSVKLY